MGVNISLQTSRVCFLSFRKQRICILKKGIFFESLSGHLADEVCLATHQLFSEEHLLLQNYFPKFQCELVKVVAEREPGRHGT